MSWQIPLAEHQQCGAQPVPGTAARSQPTSCSHRATTASRNLSTKAPGGAIQLMSSCSSRTSPRRDHPSCSFEPPCTATLMQKDGKVTEGLPVTWNSVPAHRQLVQTHPNVTAAANIKLFLSATLCFIHGASVRFGHNGSKEAATRASLTDCSRVCFGAQSSPCAARQSSCWGKK